MTEKQRDGMRRLREQRRDAGFIQLNLWVLAEHRQEVVDFARRLLFRAAREGRPMPGDDDLAFEAREAERDATLSLYGEIIVELGRSVDPGLLGFDDRECEFLAGWEDGAQQDYLDWMEADSAAYPNSSRDERDIRWEAYMDQLDEQRLPRMNSAMWRRRFDWLDRACRESPDASFADLVAAWEQDRGVK